MVFTKDEDYLIVSQLANQDYTEPTVPYLETLPLLLLKRGKEGY